jgi:ABC-2 type transport system permease protein
VSTSTVREVWTFRALVWNFAQRELKGKYKRSVLGWAWSLINPAATLLIYTIVFSTIFRAKPPPLGNGHAGNYTLFLFSGLVLWNFFSNTINGSMSSLVGVGPLLRKIYFPPFTPVAGGMVAIGVQSLIEVGVLLVAMIAVGNVGLELVLAPLVLLMLAAFSLGIGLVLSVWNVYYRDVSYLVALALQLLFYATPIIYPPQLVEDAHAHVLGMPLQDLLDLNPMAQFVDAFRDVVYDLQPPSLAQLGLLLVMSAVSLSLGWVLFHRRARDVSEEL